MTLESIERISDFFKAFSDPTRLKILYMLFEHKVLDVGALAEKLGMTDSAVSHQLKILRQQRLVAAKREGKYVYYRLDDDHIGYVLDAAYEHISE